MSCKREYSYPLVFWKICGVPSGGATKITIWYSFACIEAYDMEAKSRDQTNARFRRGS